MGSRCVGSRCCGRGETPDSRDGPDEKSRNQEDSPTVGEVLQHLFDRRSVHVIHPVYLDERIGGRENAVVVIPGAADVVLEEDEVTDHAADDEKREEDPEDQPGEFVPDRLGKQPGSQQQGRNTIIEKENGGANGCPDVRLVEKGVFAERRGKQDSRGKEGDPEQGTERSRIERESEKPQRDRCRDRRTNAQSEVVPLADGDDGERNQGPGRDEDPGIQRVGPAVIEIQRTGKPGEINETYRDPERQRPVGRRRGHPVASNSAITSAVADKALRKRRFPFSIMVSILSMAGIQNSQITSSLYPPSPHNAKEF